MKKYVPFDLSPEQPVFPKKRKALLETRNTFPRRQSDIKSRGGGVLPYMGHIGMFRCEGYGFQAVYSSIGYINQSVWV